VIALAREDPDERDRICQLWEASVRATHHFLTEADLAELVPLAREALRRVTPLHCLRERDGSIYAFMFVQDDRIEMLFVDPPRRGQGAGRTLAQHAIAQLHARFVDVNEQNPAAVGFYEHLGFRVVARSPLDGQGKPFPILHMELGAGEGA
jgi:putative acetyltransferase